MNHSLVCAVVLTGCPDERPINDLDASVFTFDAEPLLKE